jgi:serine/threonine-protein kinase ATR
MQGGPLSTDGSVNLLREADRLWLKSAKIARKAGYFQAAYSGILHANKLEAPFLEVEKAKWMWSQGEQHQAMTDLRRFVQAQGLVGPGPSASTQTPRGPVDPTSEKFIRAKAKLLLARWMEETSGGHTSTVIAQYTDALTELS